MIKKKLLIPISLKPDGVYIKYFKHFSCFKYEVATNKG